MFTLKPQDEKLQIFDSVTGYPVIWGGEISLCYTWQTDDVTAFERPHDCTPYDAREGKLSFAGREGESYILRNAPLQSVLKITPVGQMLRLDLSTDREDFSEFGLNLPFNFMGKLNGGGYENQYLFNSPYRSSDGQYQYCYLKNCNGRDLAVLFLSQADGWKMDYSRYVGGHYFYNLKCHANFDRVYGTRSHRKTLSLMLIPAKSVTDGIEKCARVLNVPALTYEKSYTFDGTATVNVIGPCDYVEVNGTRFVPEDGRVTVTGVYRKTLLTPYYQGKKGMDCSLFGYEDLFKDYENACDVSAQPYWDGHMTFLNVCEAHTWAGAMLKYMLRFGRKPEYDRRMQMFFDVLLPKDSKDAITRLSIVKEPVDGFPAYSVYKSRRIQEHHFAVSILLDAYKLYQKEEYLTYAIRTLDSLIENYQKEDGRLETTHGEETTDYSTVCCLIIPYVDMALFMENRDRALYEKYKNAASKLAAHLYRRGFCFPTEGGGTEEAEEQMEDGSISCSALALLYYCAKIERNEEYIRQAKAFLDFHEAWVMETPDANVHRSSLRWWETRWEGDADGPALCCGHAWTIWRSEADYWYYYLTGDVRYWEKAMSGFTTNFAKFDEQGHGKSIYHMDYITGGGFGYLGSPVRQFRLAPRFPEREDMKTARYVWSRAAESILQCPLCPQKRQ